MVTPWNKSGGNPAAGSSAGVGNTRTGDTKFAHRRCRAAAPPSFYLGWGCLPVSVRGAGSARDRRLGKGASGGGGRRGEREIQNVGLWGGDGVLIFHQVSAKESPAEAGPARSGCFVTREKRRRGAPFFAQERGALPRLPPSCREGERGGSRLTAPSPPRPPRTTPPPRAVGCGGDPRARSKAGPGDRRGNTLARAQLFSLGGSPRDSPPPAGAPRGQSISACSGFCCAGL